MAGVAKGSFYQYFEDKMDLYVYLMSRATDEKLAAFGVLVQSLDQMDFLEQIESLYMTGIEYAITRPKYAELAKRFAEERQMDVKNAILKGNSAKAYSFYEQLIGQAKAKHTIREDVNTRALAMLISALNDSVMAYITEEYGLIDYERDKEAILKFIRYQIEILKNGIDNVTGRSYT
jgi:AcrR family transcriptional regulator